MLLISILAIAITICVGNDVCFALSPQAQRELSQQVTTLQQRYEQVGKDNRIEPSQANREILNRLDGNFSRIKNLQTQIANLEADAQNAESRSNQIKMQLAQLRERSIDSSNLLDVGTDELESRLQTLREEIESANSQYKNLEAERKQAANGKTAFRDKLDKNNVRISELKAELADLTGAVDQADDLNRLDKETELLLLETVNSYLRTQLQSIEVDQKFNITSLRIELLEAQLSQSRDLEAALTKEISRNKQDAAAAQAKAASENAKKAANEFPWLAKSEEINVELANEIKAAAEELSNEELSAAQLDRQINELELKFNSTTSTIAERGQSAANSTSVGAILRKLKAELPSEQESLQNAGFARQLVEDLHFKELEIEIRMDELSVDVIRQELESIGIKDIDGQLASNKSAVAEIVERRRKFLSDYLAVTDDRLENQFKIESANLKLAKTVNEINHYINERILWIRSNRLLFMEFTLDKKDGDLVGLTRWSEIPGLASERLKKHPIYFINLSIFITILLAARHRLRRRVDELGAIARRGSCATFWPTAWSSVMSILIAATVPSILVGLGWGLSRDLPSTRLMYDALSQSLMAAGTLALPFEILRRICRPEGLAICHFDWVEGAVTKLQRELKWFIVPATVGVFSINVFVILGDSHQVDLVERILFVTIMGLTGLLLYRVFNPRSGIFSAYLKRNEQSWANQTSFFWLAFILFIPAGLAGLTIVGYYYTALNLTRYLVFTFALALSVELIRALVRRFVLVRRRRAHIEQAKRVRAAEIAAQKELREKADEEKKRQIDAGEITEDSSLPKSPRESQNDLQLDSIDIDENAGHANQLIKLIATAAWIVGLWLIWGDALPALKALDEYKVWGPEFVANSTESINSEVSAEELTGSENTNPSFGQMGLRNEQAAANPVDKSISVSDLIVFLTIAVITLFAARSLPNAVEMVFLDELPVDRSARLATKSLFSYAIVLIGIVLSMRSLSIDWSSIQWLVTALTFGLAFGLQEIFANFVAGIILMFERPMRIGDLITVDEFTGVVTRIRTRATTIVNWDRKEYIIPNRDFITGRLVNWTLSDAINRIQFTVGIAYGSDVAKAKKIAFDICRQHENIVDEPKTSITFEEFADSSLNLVIRTFLAHVDQRLEVIDDLHMRINDSFQEAGIEIAFPQRDLHIRTLNGNPAGDRLFES